MKPLWGRGEYPSSRVKSKGVSFSRRRFGIKICHHQWASMDCTTSFPDLLSQAAPPAASRDAVAGSVGPWLLARRVERRNGDRDGLVAGWGPRWWGDVAAKWSKNGKCKWLSTRGDGPPMMINDVQWGIYDDLCIQSFSGAAHNHGRVQAGRDGKKGEAHPLNGN